MKKILALLLFTGGMGLSAPTAWACGAGSYPDPNHAWICAASPPVSVPPGYGWPPEEVNPYPHQHSTGLYGQ